MVIMLRVQLEIRDRRSPPPLVQLFIIHWQHAAYGLQHLKDCGCPSFSEVEEVGLSEFRPHETQVGG